jgi:hypothetical protein
MKKFLKADMRPASRIVLLLPACRDSERHRQKTQAAKLAAS